MKIDCKINNNKLQIPVNNLWWQNRQIIAVCLLFILLFVSPVYAFEDSVQRYPTSSISDFWTIDQSASAAYSSVVNFPSQYPTSNSIRFWIASYYQYSSMLSKDMMSTNYLSWTNRDYNYDVNNLPLIRIDYYNSSMVSLGSLTISDYVKTYYDGDRFEVVRNSNSMLLYVNGNYLTNLGSIYEDSAYIKFYVGGLSGCTDIWWTIDDISTSSIIGINEDWTQSDIYIDSSFGIQSYSSFPSSVFTYKTYSLLTGNLINSTVLDNNVGFVRYNRDSIFGSNFGVYQSILMRDSSVLASKTYSIFDTTVGGAVIFTESEYDQSESESVQVVISSPDFDTYDYAFNFVSSSGSFSQNLVSADTWVDIDFSTVGLGTAYGILSRSGGGSDIEIAFDTVDVVEVAPYLLKFVPSVVYGNSSLNFAWSVGDYVTGYGGESFTLVYNVSGTLSGDPFYSGSHSLKGPFDPSNFGSVGPYYINYLINDSINGSINAYIVQEYSNPVYTSFIIPDSIIHTVIHPAGSNYTEPEPPVVPPWDPGDFPSDNETDVVINDSDLDNLPDIPDFNQSDFNNSALLNGSLNLSGTSTYYSGVSDSVDGFFSTSVGVMSWALSPVVTLTSSVVSFNSVLESSLSSTSSSSDSIFSDIGYIFKNLNSKVNGVILFSLCLIVLLVILGR